MVSNILEVLYKLPESRLDNVPTLDKIWVRLIPSSNASVPLVNNSAPRNRNRGHLKFVLVTAGNNNVVDLIGQCQLLRFRSMRVISIPLEPSDIIASPAGAAAACQSMDL